MPNQMTRLGVITLILGMTIGVTNTVEAGFLNDTIHSQYYIYSNTLFDDEGIKTVSPSATFTAYENLQAGRTAFLQATFTDTKLTITANVYPYGNQDFFASPFDGFVFTETGGNLGVTSFSVDSATNVAGFSASDVTLSQGQLLVNLSGLMMPSSGVISLDFGPTTVPEPSSVALVGMGLAIAMAYGRRACRRAAG